MHFALTRETERERTEWLGLFGCQKCGGLGTCRLCCMYLALNLATCVHVLDPTAAARILLEWRPCS